MVIEWSGGGPIEGIEDVLSFIVHEMKSALDLDVPLKVHAEFADNWLEGK